MDIAIHATQKPAALESARGRVHSAGFLTVAMVAAVALIGGCGGPVPVPPQADIEPTPAVDASSLLLELNPRRATRFGLEWTHQTHARTARGTAVAWFLPPDSLCFEYRAPFGRRGAAVFIGQQVSWANPEETINDLIPATQLFWTVLGIPIAPEDHDTPEVTLRADGWAVRYVFGDTLLVLNLTRGSPSNLTAMVSHGEGVFGTAYSAFSDATGLPESGRMMFPRSSTLFLATIREVDTLAVVDRAKFRRP